MIFSAVREALRTIRAHPLRSVLTMLCVVWGSASVIFLLSWGAGLAVMLETSMERVGRNLITAWAGYVGEDFTPAVDRRDLWFTPEDVRALRASFRHGDIVVGESALWGSVAFRQRMLQIDTRGVEPATLELRGVRIAAGRRLTQADLDNRRRVALLGVKARERVLGPQGGVGSRIRIDGRSFEVVGLLDRVGTQLWRGGPTEIDEQIWVPLTTLLAFERARPAGLNQDVLENISARFHDRRDKEAAKQEIRAILAKRLGVSPTDVEAVHLASPTDTLERLPVSQVGSLLGLIAITTLTIGGIGILNLMLESVHERRREIGVRLAVGGRRADVVAQFLVETIVITGIGGLAGIALGILLSWSLAFIEVPDLIPLPILQPHAIALSVAVLAAVGVLAGVVPAARASRMDPALTLRVDA